MVSYAPLWETMQKKGITTYTLIKKHDIPSKTIYNLKHNKNISTATLEILCDMVKSFFVCKFTFSLLGYCILCGVLAELCKDAALFFIVFCHIE